MRLKEQEVEELISSGTTQNIAKHEYLFRSGETCDRVFLLTQGRVKYFYSSAVGRDIIMEFVMPGNLFCIEAAFKQHSEPTNVRRFSARTCEDSTVVLIEAERFINLLGALPDFALRIIHQLSNRTQLLEKRLSNILVDDVVSRVSYTLINFRDNGYIEYDFPGGFTLPLTQQDIADTVGAARQTVHRALHFLKDRGLIEIFPQRILIKDVKALELLSRSGEVKL